MSIIIKYALVDIVGGTPTSIDYADSLTLFTGNADGEGLVHYNSLLYHVFGAAGANGIRRVYEGVSPHDMAVELNATPTAAPDNFLNPTFATIITGAPPPLSSSTFGSIIW